MVNHSPIPWLAKKQSTIETSVFGAKFVAMKQGVDTFCGLRYGLRMMGVQSAGPSFIYGDKSMSVYTTRNTRIDFENEVQFRV